MGGSQAGPPPRGPHCCCPPFLRVLPTLPLSSRAGAEAARAWQTPSPFLRPGPDL